MFLLIDAFSRVEALLGESLCDHGAGQGVGYTRPDLLTLTNSLKYFCLGNFIFFCAITRAIILETFGIKDMNHYCLRIIVLKCLGFLAIPHAFKKSEKSIKKGLDSYLKCMTLFSCTVLVSTPPSRSIPFTAPT